VDTLIVDLPDVGCRVYTYLNTLAHCLKAAAEVRRAALTKRRWRVGRVGGIGRMQAREVAERATAALEPSRTPHLWGPSRVMTTRSRTTLSAWSSSTDRTPSVCATVFPTASGPTSRATYSTRPSAPLSAASATRPPLPRSSLLAHTLTLVAFARSIGGPEGSRAASGLCSLSQRIALLCVGLSEFIMAVTTLEASLAAHQAHWSN